MDSAYSIRRTVQSASDRHDATDATTFGMEFTNFAEFGAKSERSSPGAGRRHQHPSAAGYGHP